jgi:hypothetical protein
VQLEDFKKQRIGDWRSMDVDGRKMFVYKKGDAGRV